MSEDIYARSFQNLNTFCQENLFPDNLLNQQSHKLKPKAYINPLNINYEYIKNSLSKKPSQANKIHVNPKFGKIANMVSLVPNMDYLSIGKKSSLDSSITSFNGKNSAQSSKVSLNNMSSRNSSSKYIFINQNSYKNVPKDLYPWTTKNKNNETKFQMQIKKRDLTKFEIVKTNEESVNKNPFKYKSKKLLLATHFQGNLSNKKYLTNNTKKPVNPYLSKNVNNTVNYNKSNSGFKKIHSAVRQNSNQFKFISNKSTESVIKLASLIRNKYKYCKSGTLKNTTYKIDKSKILEKRKNIRKLFPVTYNRSKFYSTLYYNSQCFYSLGPKNILSWRNNKKLEKLCNGKPPIYQNKKIVKIGGIIYKSTSNKLTIANKNNIDEGSPNTLNKKKIKGKNCLVVYVRGEKFLLGKNGKTLKKQNVGTNSNNSCFKRIDLGGITYLQKSQNVLIRTNLHRARDLVNQAKIKSIATLCHLRKKTSLPCMIYHKFGKCNRHSKGLCMYKHDPKNISICKMFLKGECSNKNCLLSHEPIKEKMAECHFFINGSCSKESCPFLHVKLNKNADICENFSQGFCTLGENCLKRHLSQNQRCNKFKTSSLKAECSIKETGKETSSNEEVKYFCKHPFTLNDKKEKRKKSLSMQCERKKGAKKGKISKIKSTQLSDNSPQNVDTLECFPKRVKLDELPAFIPLNLNK